MLSPTGFSRVIVMDDEDPEAVLVIEMQVMRFVPEE